MGVCVCTSKNALPELLITDSAALGSVILNISFILGDIDETFKSR